MLGHRVDFIANQPYDSSVKVISTWSQAICRPVLQFRGLSRPVSMLFSYKLIPEHRPPLKFIKSLTAIIRDEGNISFIFSRYILAIQWSSSVAPSEPSSSLCSTTPTPTASANPPSSAIQSSLTNPPSSFILSSPIIPPS